ncbi:MAG: SDR family NAD(P)-dependent oxidoreductase [Chitinophagaceae bacterium]
MTGGDSGIGRAVAIGFAMEGANIAIVYNVNDDDANETKRLCEKNNTKCLLIKGDVRNSDECKEAIKKTVEEFGALNILVNNAAYQMAQKNLRILLKSNCGAHLKQIFSVTFLWRRLPCRIYMKVIQLLIPEALLAKPVSLF